MSSDLIQEIIEVLVYSIENKDWNSVEEALELIRGEESDSVFDEDP
jgi:hypothetical protein